MAITQQQSAESRETLEEIFWVAAKMAKAGADISRYVIQPEKGATV